ncbi:MAG: hypothetical protein WKF83_14985 [Nocardioidaceae bacterium]
MTSEGFTNKGAVAAYRAFTSFLLGHLLLEVAARGAQIAPIHDEEVTRQGESLAKYPQIVQVQVELAEDHSLAEFEDSLENLLTRIAMLRG